MKTHRSLFSLIVITVLYLAALVWADSNNRVFSSLPVLAAVLPTVMAMAFVSYLFRYLRWRWLLAHVNKNTPWIEGFLAYLAGFAFTATPGKVGELVRIRYFGPMGVAPTTVLGAFVYERAVDLLVVLALCCLAITQMEVFLVVLTFVVCFLGAIVFVARRPQILVKAGAYLRLRGFKRLTRLFITLKGGLTVFRVWVAPKYILGSMLLGAVAWFITSGSFVWLLHQLDVSIQLVPALAIYPLAMLAGAASMLPGGVGSTEVTIVALLAVYSVPVAVATLAAVGVRFATLWFAVLCGLVACAVLERRLLTR